MTEIRDMAMRWSGGSLIPSKRTRTSNDGNVNSALMEEMKRKQSLFLGGASPLCRWQIGVEDWDGGGVDFALPGSPAEDYFMTAASMAAVTSFSAVAGNFTTFRWPCRISLTTSVGAVDVTVESTDVHGNTVSEVVTATTAGVNTTFVHNTQNMTLSFTSSAQTLKVGNYIDATDKADGGGAGTKAFMHAIGVPPYCFPLIDFSERAASLIDAGGLFNGETRVFSVKEATSIARNAGESYITSINRLNIYDITSTFCISRTAYDQRITESALAGYDALGRIVIGDTDHMAEISNYSYIPPYGDIGAFADTHAPDGDIIYTVEFQMSSFFGPDQFDNADYDEFTVSGMTVG